jgi:hypothetical protein
VLPGEPVTNCDRFLEATTCDLNLGSTHIDLLEFFGLAGFFGAAPSIVS